MEGTTTPVGDPVHNANLERTVRELQRAKDEAQAAVNKMKATVAQVDVTDETLSRRLAWEMLTKAHRDVAESDPFLPFPGSVLPALLALRQTHQATSETNDYIDSQEVTMEQANKRLEALRAELRDQQALHAALQKRAQSLRDDVETRMETSPEDMAREKIVELKKKKAHYNKETSNLLKMLNWFIEEHLGPMLAAEELGGPVVGDMMEIDSEDLSAGFSAQGKPKKTKGKPGEDRRQRRIDDIWGNQGTEQDQMRKRKREPDEASAAGVEMLNITEQLLNKLAESGGDTSSAYVQIPRESAAARFLVRSKVAVFHPRDSSRIRLVDFGREIED